MVEHQRLLEEVKAEEGTELIEKGKSVFVPSFSAFLESVPGSGGESSERIKVEAKKFYELVNALQPTLASTAREPQLDDEDLMDLEIFDVDTKTLEGDIPPPVMPSKDSSPEAWEDFRIKYQEHENSRQDNAKKRKAEAGKLKEAYGKLSTRKGGLFKK